VREGPPVATFEGVAGPSTGPGLRVFKSSRCVSGADQGAAGVGSDEGGGCGEVERGGDQDAVQEALVSAGGVAALSRSIGKTSLPTAITIRRFSMPGHVDHHAHFSSALNDRLNVVYLEPQQLHCFTACRHDCRSDRDGVLLRSCATERQAAHSRPTAHIRSPYDF